MLGPYANRTCYHAYQSGSANLTYTLSNCPYCLGEGQIHDFIFQEDGSIRTAEGADKLQQDLEKILIEKARADGYGFEFADLSGRTAGRFTEERLRAATLSSIRFLMDLQQEMQDQGVYVPPDELISEIGDVTVQAVENQPDYFRISVTLKTLSAKNAEISLAVPVR